MAKRSSAAGIAKMPSRTTPATRVTHGRFRMLRAHLRPLVGFSSSGSGTLGPGMRVANARVPSRPRSAGRKVSATSTATNTVAAAAKAIDVRKGMPMMDRAASAINTVAPAKTTEPPAVPSAIPMAWARLSTLIVRSCAASSFGERSLSPEEEISSLRNRATMNSE